MYTKEVQAEAIGAICRNYGISAQLNHKGYDLLSALELVNVSKNDITCQGTCVNGGLCQRHIAKSNATKGLLGVMRLVFDPNIVGEESPIRLQVASQQSPDPVDWKAACEALAAKSHVLAMEKLQLEEEVLGLREKFEMLQTEKADADEEIAGLRDSRSNEDQTACEVQNSMLVVENAALKEKLGLVRTMIGSMQCQLEGAEVDSKDHHVAPTLAGKKARTKAQTIKPEDPIDHASPSSRSALVATPSTTLSKSAHPSPMATPRMKTPPATSIRWLFMSPPTTPRESNSTRACKSGVQGYPTDGFYLASPARRGNSAAPSPLTGPASSNAKAVPFGFKVRPRAINSMHE